MPDYFREAARWKVIYQLLPARYEPVFLGLQRALYFLVTTQCGRFGISETFRIGRLPFYFCEKPSGNIPQTRSAHSTSNHVRPGDRSPRVIIFKSGKLEQNGMLVTVGFRLRIVRKATNRSLSERQSVAGRGFLVIVGILVKLAGFKSHCGFFGRC